MLDVKTVGSNLADGATPHPGNGLDEVVLAPDLDHRVIDEYVHELGLEGVADREHLVVDRHDAVGSDASKHPLAVMVFGCIDRDRSGVGRKGCEAEPVGGGCHLEA